MTLIYLPLAQGASIFLEPQSNRQMIIANSARMSSDVSVCLTQTQGSLS